MTADYHKLDQVVILFAADGPDVMSLLRQISTSPGAWYATIDVAKASFSVPAYKDHQKQSVLSWQRQQYTFSVLSPA